MHWNSYEISTITRLSSFKVKKAFKVSTVFNLGFDLISARNPAVAACYYV